MCGDGGPAHQAARNNPHSIQFGPDGHLYICDIADHVFRRAGMRAGIISTYAGTGKAGDTPDGASIAVSGVSDFDYTHYRTLAKLGVAWQTELWNAGLSVTTPSLGAFGSGKAGYTLSIAGTDANGDGRPDPPILETSTQEDLDTDYRSPWAVGVGASRTFGRTRLYARAEWVKPSMILLVRSSHSPQTNRMERPSSGILPGQGRLCRSNRITKTSKTGHKHRRQGAPGEYV